MALVIRAGGTAAEALQAFATQRGPTPNQDGTPLLQAIVSGSETFSVDSAGRLGLSFQLKSANGSPTIFRRLTTPEMAGLPIPAGTPSQNELNGLPKDAAPITGVATNADGTPRLGANGEPLVGIVGYTDSHGTILAPPGAAIRSTADRMAVFAQNDADGDGKVTMDEYRAISAALAGTVTFSDTIFGQRDTDHDGFISSAEHAAVTASRPQN